MDNIYSVQEQVICLRMGVICLRPNTGLIYYRVKPILMWIWSFIIQDNLLETILTGSTLASVTTLPTPKYIYRFSVYIIFENLFGKFKYQLEYEEYLNTYLI